jgi:tetraacyldisaccharide 4'-kinase
MVVPDLSFTRREGANSGFAPPWLAPVTLPLGVLYRLLVGARTLAYRKGWLRTERAGVPVVSVGNLTVGGSGKTPFVDYLLREALRAGLHPACLSRGYGRRGRSHVARVRVADRVPADPVALGDEPSLLAQRNPEVPIYVGSDRAASGRLAQVLDAVDVLVLDDGYQHLRLARDLNILLVDAQRGFGNGRLLPRGPLREPLSALARADVIVISKANLGDADGIRRQLQDTWHAAQPIFRCDFRPGRLVRLDGGAELPVTALQGARVSLLCGIAQPEGFRRVVTEAGAFVGEMLAFPDHHPFRAAGLADVDGRIQRADAGGARWITTEKDATKLRGRLKHADRLWVLEMDVVPEAAARAFFFDSLRRLTIK